MNFKETYWDAWQLAWSFHKEHFPVDGKNPQYWESVCNDYRQICERCRDKPGFELMRDLLLAVLGELERVGGCYGKYAKEGEDTE